MIIKQCDFCKQRIDTTCITIGSNDGDSLIYHNENHTEHQLIQLGRYSDLHFCNKEHFINYFFNRQLMK